MVPLLRLMAVVRLCFLANVATEQPLTLTASLGEPVAKMVQFNVMLPGVGSRLVTGHAKQDPWGVSEVTKKRRVN